MKKLRLLSMALICFFAASLSISVNAAISESFSLDSHSVNFDSEHVINTNTQVPATKRVSDEVLLLGAAIIGLIGITIMRKTLH